MNPEQNSAVNPHALRRVLMTADTVGGVWTYALELARVLCEQEVEVAFATMGARLTEEQWDEVESIPNIGVFERDFKLEWMHEPWKDVDAAGKWLLELDRTLRPDIVHLNNYAHGTLPFGAPKLMVAHSDVLSWWRAVKGEEAPEDWNRYREVVAAGLRAADMVVAPSQSALIDTLHQYGPLRHTDVIANGREISFRHVAKEPFIFSAGRLWDEAKNIGTLASIASELRWPVRVAGDALEPDGGESTKHQPPSSRETPNTKCQTPTTLLGRLNQAPMADYLERAAIYCLPVRYEPFGLSVLEAALAGCALVLGDIPSQREIWRDAALFVPPNDARVLRDALQRLIDDPVTRGQLAERAHERALEFTTFRMGTSYLAAYSRLIEQAKQPAQLLCAS